MKKIILATGAIIGIGAIGVPYIIGGQAETIFNEQAAVMKKQLSASNMTLHKAEFKRGIFSSEANISFSLPNTDKTTKGITVEATSTITNGPFIITDNGIKFAAAASSSSFDLSGLPPELSAITGADHLKGFGSEKSVLGFDGQSSGVISIKPINIQTPNGQAEFKGAQGSYSTDAALEKMDYTIDMQAINITSPMLNLSINGIEGTCQLNKHSDNVYYGDYNINMPELSVSASGTTSSFKDFSINVKSDIKDELMNMTQTFAVKDMSVAGAPVKSASYSFSLNKLNPSSLEDIQKFSQDIQAASQDPQNILSPADIFPVDQLRPLLTKIMTKGLQFNQELDINAMGADHNAKIDIEFIGTPNDKHIMDLKSPAEALSCANANISLTLAENAVLMTPLAVQIDPLLNKGFIKKENGNLVFTAKLQGGKLSIAGKDFPLDGLLPAAF